MLSYQHLYHAGNLADVHKHALLSWALDYLTQKDKPLTYIESHAGRGLYDLGAEEALKTGEAAAGIALAEGWFADKHPYRRCLKLARDQFGKDAYPGSPLIAALSLRRGDALHLAELHPQEHEHLRANLLPWSANVVQKDGLDMALALTPPDPRRGMLLIDPSYEVKSEYARVTKVVHQINRRWNVGIIALWYPLLGDGRHLAMLDMLTSMFPEALRHEVQFPPVRDGHRMEGAGMFIVNPPFGLAAEAKRIGAHFAKLARATR